MLVDDFPLWLLPSHLKDRPLLRNLLRNHLLLLHWRFCDLWHTFPALCELRQIPLMLLEVREYPLYLRCAHP
jgi:hypothetical protein